MRYKCSHMYSYKKEAEGVLRQKRSRETTEAKTGMMQSPIKECLDPPGAGIIPGRVQRDKDGAHILII